MMSNANRRFFLEGQTPTSTMVILGPGTDKDGNCWPTSDHRHETGTRWLTITTVNRRFCLAAHTWPWALRVQPLAIHGDGTEDHGSSDKIWVRLRDTELLWLMTIVVMRRCYLAAVALLTRRVSMQLYMTRGNSLFHRS